MGYLPCLGTETGCLSDDLKELWLLVHLMNGYKAKNTLISQDALLVCLFDLMLMSTVNSLRSCWDGQLPNHTVPGEASHRQFTSIKCPFYRQ